MATTQTLADLRALHERIVESIRSGLITTDLQGRIYTFNLAAEEITGYKSEEVIGKHISTLFGEIGTQIQESLNAAEEGELSPRFEAVCVTPDELHLRLGFSISPLFAEGGETKGLIIAFQDMTDVRAMEETARRQDRLAAVGRVAAGIAHEIRNPLAAMRGAIQVLQSDLNGNSSEAQLMGIILNESDRLNKIITDFLTYARPRLAEFELVDVSEAVNETLTLLKHSPELKEKHLLEEVLPDEPMMTRADMAQLKQVFWNLSRNAIQAMPAGGTLRVEMRRRKNGRIQIMFTDTGCGMSPQQVERLFEPFTSTKGSTGLGLSIVYQIIRDHGGSINVRSLEGQGTTITVELLGSQ
jgi:two-component system sensor histidine kinase PilS (NtrC family)